MSWIEQVAKHHKEYVKTVKGFGEYFYAEDLVQEMYIRFLNKNKENAVIVNGQVNRYYVFLTLRSLFLDFYRKKSKIIKVDISEILTLQQIDELENHEAFGSLMNRVHEEMQNWHHYDRLLFKLYKDSDLSMREIAGETKISLRSIFITLKHCKERINENVKEDYLDYVNKDYELI
ncbi:MAG: RNA polymerase sigma factor [Candidatus Fonsibacter sp.]